jgi:hypothetical protein
VLDGSGQAHPPLSFGLWVVHTTQGSACAGWQWMHPSTTQQKKVLILIMKYENWHYLSNLIEKSHHSSNPEQNPEYLGPSGI